MPTSLRGDGTLLLFAACTGLTMLLVRAKQHLAALTSKLERLQDALNVMNRAQRDLHVCAIPEQPDLVPTAGWTKCMAALQAVEDGYARFAKQKAPGKGVLHSNFVDGQPTADKLAADRLLAVIGGERSDI